MDWGVKFGIFLCFSLSAFANPERPRFPITRKVALGNCLEGLPALLKNFPKGNTKNSSQGVGSISSRVEAARTPEESFEASVNKSQKLEVGYRQLNQIDIRHILEGLGIVSRGTEGGSAVLRDTVAAEGSPNYLRSKFIPTTDVHPAFLSDAENYVVFDTKPLRQAGRFIEQSELGEKVKEAEASYRSKWVNQQAHTAVVGQIPESDILSLTLRNVNYTQSDLQRLRNRLVKYDSLTLSGNSVLMQYSEPYRQREIPLEEFQKMAPEISLQDLKRGTSHYTIYLDPNPDVQKTPLIVHVHSDAEPPAKTGK